MGIHPVPALILIRSSLITPPRFFAVSTLRAAAGLAHLRHHPLENTLVAENELAEVLHHARALCSEIVHGLGDQIHVLAVNPRAGAAVIVVVVAASLGRTHGPLPFQHVQNAVDRAESARASATRTAVHQDGPLTLWLHIVITEISITGRSRNLVALFNQFEEVSWLRSRPKIWPVRVLQLRDLPERLEGKSRVR